MFLRMLKSLALVFLLSENKTDAQLIGNFFRNPINNLIKVFDGSYWRPSYNQVQNNNRVSVQNQRIPHSYQPRPIESNLNYNVHRPVSTAYHLYNGFCGGIWTYDVDHNGNTIGLIKIHNPSRIENVLKLNLSLPEDLTANYPGTIVLAKDKDSSAQDVANGLPLLYRVQFPIQTSIPKLLSATLNDKLLCSEPFENGPYTVLSLAHTFYTGLRGDFVEQITGNKAVEYTIQSFRPSTTNKNSQGFPSTSQPEKFFRVDTNQCGVPEYQPQSFTPLVVGGRFAERGQFPWLAAFYYNGRSETGFICGGTLISSKVVVTAAHCVQEKGRSSVARTPEESLFYLGKYNLDNLAGDHYFIVSGVDRFDVHPDWNVNDYRYDADIAIAILIRAVSFNKFVKPICTWTETQSYEDLVGRKGTIVGWGKTEYSALATDRPKWTKIPIVNSLTCLRSNPAFNALTSDRTFCAGEINGSTGPCNGDSGGGLVIEINRKWYIRGIVSSALLADGVCDTRNYAVFTDVQKFSSWIRNYVQD